MYEKKKLFRNKTKKNILLSISVVYIIQIACAQ